MVKNIKIECDRCGVEVNGTVLIDGDDIVCTGGFYDVVNGWTEYAEPGEMIVCDKCMHSDPKYKEIYSPNK